jgi:hypothetical protein
MSTLVGFGTFAALPEEQISERINRRILSSDQGMILWWSIGAGVHVEPQMSRSYGCSRAKWSSASAANSGSAAKVTSSSFREVRSTKDGSADTEVIDFFAPSRDDFRLGGKPSYMSEG